jgi:hypothetical protein
MYYWENFKQITWEFRFGQYRQMSRTNYNVSVTQIMESEKKLKILSVMKVISGNDCEITLREFVAGCQTGQSEIEFTDQSANQLLSPFMSVLTDSDDFEISKTEMSALVFIAGYVGYKLKAKIACIDCRVEMLTERALECDFPVDASFDYMSSIDRGRLMWPTELLVDIVVQTIVVFKCLISTNYHKLFSRAQKQRTILAQLAVKRCDGIIDLSKVCPACNVEMKVWAQMCISTVSNICLNNYTKHLADGKTQSKSLRKLSTLTK